MLASFHRTQATLAGDLNWFPAPNQELRLKLQWLAIDARDATPFRIAPSDDPVEGGMNHLFSSAFDLRDSDQLIVKVRYRF